MMVSVLRWFQWYDVVHVTMLSMLRWCSCYDGVQVWEGAGPGVSPWDIQFSEEMEQEMTRVIDVSQSEEHLVNSSTAKL